MSARLPSPPRWLPLAVADLAPRLSGRSIDGVVSGPGWLSLRVGADFIWFFAARGLRMFWRSSRPLPANWFDALGRHHASGFASHLRGRRIDDVLLLVDSEKRAEGACLRTAGDRALELRTRFWPRPGAIWICGGDGEILVQQGRMEGSPLQLLPSTLVAPDAARRHHELCERLFHDELARQLRQDLQRGIEGEIVRLRRRQLTLQAERDEALRDRGIRAEADVLAANLHRVRRGQDSAELQDFQGKMMRVELDPSRSPSQNLDSLYRRAARADRKLSSVEQRLAASALQYEESLRKRQRLEECRDAAELFALALDLGVELNRPRTETERRRRAEQQRRLPYWILRCEGWELRVGRSARDNDLLIAQHCKGHDLWLHAQGVAGSHVVLRSGGRSVPRRIIEEAARIAAYYSKSRTSSTVPVVFTQRRYVRKPRRSPPGEVSVERGQTVFVEPGIPARWREES